MNIIGIKKTSIEDGVGVRVSVYCSYCTIHCYGCHNAEQCWDLEPKTGYVPYNEETKQEILEALDHDYIQGITCCGGEPFEEINQEGFVDLLRTVKEKFPDKDVWCWTGYQYSDILPGGKKHINITDEFLSYIDVLVVNPFIMAQRDITDNNRWRGSLNQRVIDLKKTRETGHLVMLEDVPNNSSDLVK